MRGLGGFAAGSLALIVLYVLVQPGSAKAADQASGLLVTMLKHALAADYAAIPNRGGSPTTYGRKFPTSSTTPGPSGGGSGGTTTGSGPVRNV